MKKNITRFTILFLIFSILSMTPVYAGSAAVKLGRGLTNIAGSPLEVFNGIVTVWEKHDPVTGAVGGTLVGTASMVKRIGVGLFEVLTFPFPIPENYEPVLDPATPLVPFTQQDGNHGLLG